MRVLVCGGRDYNNFGTFGIAMDMVHDELLSANPPTVVIHGWPNTGVNDMAHRWADIHGYDVLAFSSDWNDLSNMDAIIKKRRHDPACDVRSSLHRRHQRMLDEGRPDLCVAFPGGSGTDDMVARARRAGIKIIDLRSMASAKDIKL
jgi:UDP-N-acetylmuramoylalanine-D-glutamate ligase